MRHKLTPLLFALILIVSAVPSFGAVYQHDPINSDDPLLIVRWTRSSDDEAAGKPYDLRFISNEFHEGTLTLGGKDYDVTKSYQEQSVTKAVYDESGQGDRFVSGDEVFALNEIRSSDNSGITPSPGTTMYNVSIYELVPVGSKLQKYEFKGDKILGCEKKGTELVLASPGTYILTGSSDKGSVKVTGKSVTLILRDLDVKDISASNRVNIHLDGNSKTKDLELKNGGVICGKGSLSADEIKASNKSISVSSSLSANKLETTSGLKVFSGDIKVPDLSSGFIDIYSGSLRTDKINTNDISIHNGTVTGSVNTKSLDMYSGSLDSSEIKGERILIEAGTVKSGRLEGDTITFGSEESGDLDPDMTVTGGIKAQTINAVSGRYNITGGIATEKSLSLTSCDVFINSTTAITSPSASIVGGEHIYFCDTTVAGRLTVSESEFTTTGGLASVSLNQPQWSSGVNVPQGQVLDVYEVDDDETEVIFSHTSPRPVRSVTYSSINVDSEFEYRAGAGSFVPCLDSWTHQYNGGTKETEDGHEYIAYTCSLCEEETERLFAAEESYSCQNHDLDTDIIPHESDEPEIAPPKGEDGCTHELELVYRIDPTCEKAGRIEHYHCVKCGKNYTSGGSELEEVDVPAFGHTFTAWSEENGVKTRVCTVCDFEETEVIPEDHKCDPKLVKAKDPTDTEYGYIEHYECSCGKLFDEDGNELQEYDILIPKIDITYDVTEKTEDGTIKVERSYENESTIMHFLGVDLDNKSLSGNDYTVKEGSVIITIKEKVLKNLTSGKHWVSIIFDDGQATTLIDVPEKPTEKVEPKKTESVETSEKTDEKEEARKSETQVRDETVSEADKSAVSDEKDQKTASSSSEDKKSLKSKIKAKLHPETGDHNPWLYAFGGSVLILLGVLVLEKVSRHK